MAAAGLLIPLSATEIRRLLADLVLAPAVRVEQVLTWGQTGVAADNTKPAPATTAAAEPPF